MLLHYTMLLRMFMNTCTRTHNVPEGDVAGAVWISMELSTLAHPIKIQNSRIHICARRSHKRWREDGVVKITA